MLRYKSDEGMKPSFQMAESESCGIGILPSRDKEAKGQVIISVPFESIMTEWSEVVDLKYSPYFHAVTREESVSDSYLGRLKKDIKVDQINLDLFSLSCRPNKPQTTALEPPEQLKRAQAPRFTITKQMLVVHHWGHYLLYSS